MVTLTSTPVDMMGSLVNMRDGDRTVRGSGKTGDISNVIITVIMLDFYRISFCAGKDNKCISHGGGAGIKTVANATINSPGVITHTYDSALSPQIGT